MARLPRLNLPDIPQHVMQRGNNRSVCFFSDNDYKSLFDNHIPDYTIKEINQALNKAWALVDDRFLEQIEKQTGRRVKPNKRGGDRKSKEFRKR